MNRLRIGLAVLCLLGFCNAARSDEKPAKRHPREVLRAFNDLIGTWRATGTPEGTREEKQRGFWVETMSWEWQFKGDDAWLTFTIDKGKHYTGGTLRYLPAKDAYQLTLTKASKDQLVFEGELKDSRLTVEREDEQKKETQRLVFSFLHANRFVYRYEVKPQAKTLFSRVYEIGATKEGVPFAGKGDGRPECVVSGGLGTIPVMHKGKTYYVCCTGCRDAFKEEPEKFIKEFEEKNKQK